MAQVPSSSLPFNDSAVNGNVVTQTEWNQMNQVFQTAINDNFYRIVEQFNVLNADGTTNKSMQVASASGTTNVVQFEMGAGITISAIQNGGNITFTFSIGNGAITESMLASGILQDVFYTQTQLNAGQLNNLYYTKAQVDAEVNNASYTKTVQTGTSFPMTPTTGQEFYRTDLHQLYVYDSGQGQWNSTQIQVSDATTSAVGLVEVSDAPSGAHPVAVTTDNAAYKAVNGGTFVQAGTGIKTTAGTDSETVAIDTATTALTNYLRTDSGAPNPQTVENPVNFQQGIAVGEQFTPSNATEIDMNVDGNSGASTANAQKYYWARVPQKQIGITSKVDYGLVAYDGTSFFWPFAVDYANKVVGVAGDSGWKLVTTSGQLGSASGTYTVGSGALSGLAAGSVINIASVPSGAKNFNVEIHFTGTALGTPQAASGSTNASGSGWFAVDTSGAASGGTAGISSTSATGKTLTLFDGNNKATGYFQINGGYLQFVLNTASVAQTGYGYSNVRWGVS